MHAETSSPRHRPSVSAHALGRLLVSTPTIFDMLSTRDVRHLRRADKALRSLVAEHPWTDSATPVSRLLAEWRSSFPAATACRLESPTLTKGQLAQLEGLTSFTSVGFRSKAEENEQPLAAVRTMPRLEALTVVDCHTALGRGADHALKAPSDTVWGELRSLRELSVTLPCSAIPLALLSSLNGAVLRKLSLCVSNSWDTGTTRIRVSDAALAALPLLEELCLDGTLLKGFSGTGLAMLSRLVSLKLRSATLAEDVFASAPASLRSVDVSGSTGMTDATFSAPCFAGVTSLTLNRPPESMTSAAFAGLFALEVLDLAIHEHTALIADAALAVLGSHRRLRRLRCSWELPYTEL